MTEPTNEEILQEFERGYQLFHNLSEQRIRDQKKMLIRFSELSGKPLVKCGAEDLRNFLAGEVERGLAPSTVRRNGNLIRPFFSWMYSVGHIDGNVLMDVKNVKNPRGAVKNRPDPYSAKELRRFWADLDRTYPLLPEHRLNYYFTGRAKYPRIARHALRLQTEALVNILLYCGLRRQEAFDLTIDDMHPENAYIVVRNGKGEKPRQVPHTKQTREAISAWLKFRERLTPPHDQPWLSLYWTQPEDQALQPMGFKAFEAQFRKIGPYRFHRFRHTCATNWLRAGMSLDKVSRLLGHANITQTMAYLELVREDIAKATEEHNERFTALINGGE